MKDYIRFAFVLFVVSAVASGILAFVDNFTMPIIKQNQRKEKESARRAVLPQADKFEKIGTINNEGAFIAKDKSGNIVGYTFVAAGYGYSSNVKTMVGLKPDFSINKIKIIYQSETPGLGANSEKPWFQEQFSGKSLSVLKVDKDGGAIKSLTGATITSRAVTNSINRGISELESLVKQTATGGSK